MNNHYDILQQLRTEWSLIGSSATSRITWQRLCREHELEFLDNETDLAAVLLRLEPGGGLHVEQRAQVVQVLLEEASDRFVHRTLLQTMLPGVVSTCRQLNFGRGIVASPSDVLNEAIGLLSDIISSWAGESRLYAAPDLLSALRGRLRRWLLKEKAIAKARAGEVPEDATSPESSTLESRLRLLLEHDNLSRLARLTWQRVFANATLAELAAHEGVSPRVLRDELRSFAEQHLL